MDPLIPPAKRSNTRFRVTSNHAPCGAERAYGGLRLADSLARRDGAQAKVFLVDADH